MPTVSRWFIRSALACLIAGMAMGSWMLVQQARGEPAPGGAWPVLHAHVLLVGFLLQVVMGVAYWMFPRVQGRRPGNVPAWAALACLNAGLALRVVAEPVVDDGHGGAWRVLLGAAAVLPTLGAVLFAYAVAPRVKAAMSREEADRLRARAAARRSGDV